MEMPLSTPSLEDEVKAVGPEPQPDDGDDDDDDDGDDTLLVDVSVGFSPNQFLPLSENENGDTAVVVVDLKAPNTDSQEEVAEPVVVGFSESSSPFCVSDLVWGKVKSHPWWPGQIFHTSDASERAIKYKKKDRILVAYFGDQTFAWNRPSSLNHFQSHFPLMVNQTNSQPFCTAVDVALNELGRRVVLGMLCPCTPNHFYQVFKSPQIFKNAGITHKRRTTTVASPISATSFDSVKLLHLIKALAPNPFAPLDRLDLKIAQSQLMAFFFSKGYSHLPQFLVCGGLLEDDHLLSPTPNSPRSTNYASDGGLHPSTKKRSLSDLLAGKKASKSFTKRNAVCSLPQDLVAKSKKGMSSIQRDVDSDSPAPQSFKVGECIRRIASQLTGTPPILKCTSGKFQPSADKIHRGSENEENDTSLNIPEGSHRRLIVPKEFSSPDVMLSQLCLAARDPMKGYSFLSVIVDFFSDFRNSISLECSTTGKQKRSERTGRGIRKSYNTNNISNEAFDFEEMGDSYWTDMVIQSSSEEQLSRRSRKRKLISEFEVPTELDGSSYEVEDPLQLGLVLDFGGKNHDDEYIVANEKPSRKYRKRKTQIMLPLDKPAVVAEKTIHRLNDNKYENDFSPTALLLSFMEPDSVPSEMNLNKIFRRFGPLKESETKILRDTGSAIVVFKKQTDAEVAFSSAAKFNIFGPVNVSYQLRFQV